VSAVRWLAAGSVVAASAIGSAVDTSRVAPPIVTGGYHVIAADFHVHAFPGDGALPAWELAREASRRGLHAIAVSNHNQTLAPKILPGLFSGVAIVIPSQEVTAPRFHLIAAGITSTIDWRLPDVEMMHAIHRQGGVVIAAHPVRRFWQGDDAMLPLLDGVEVAHPLARVEDTARGELTAFFGRARAVNPDIAPIGSSDTHMVAPLGRCRTYVLAESITVESVLEAIRAGRTVAEDQDGVRYGDPALTRLLDQAGVTAAPPVQRLATLSAWLALMALFALVILD
jgi:predicted metal-dependent phosphoesterase TrpH